MTREEKLAQMRRINRERYARDADYKAAQKRRVREWKLRTVALEARPDPEVVWHGVLSGHQYADEPRAIPSEGPFRMSRPHTSSTGEASMAWAG